MCPTSTWCCPTTPPVWTTARTTSPRKRRPHGKPPSAGTTSMQSSGSPKFERSEQRQRPTKVRADCHLVFLDLLSCLETPPKFETSLFLLTVCNYRSRNQLCGQSHNLVSLFKVSFLQGWRVSETKGVCPLR